MPTPKPLLRPLLFLHFNIIRTCHRLFLLHLTDHPQQLWQACPCLRDLPPATLCQKHSCSFLQVPDWVLYLYLNCMPEIWRWILQLPSHMSPWLHHSPVRSLAFLVLIAIWTSFWNEHIHFTHTHNLKKKELNIAATHNTREQFSYINSKEKIPCWLLQGTQ